MIPTLQLDNYFLTRLQVDLALPKTDQVIEVKATDCVFDYDVAIHKERPQHRLLRFKAIFQELDGQKQKIGYHVECEMVGFFTVTEATPKGQEEAVIRLNGVSQLYGALRGILATATGMFACGRLNLPSIMPQEIVEQVEKRRAAAQARVAVAAAPAAQTPSSTSGPIAAPEPAPTKVRD